MATVAPTGEKGTVDPTSASVRIPGLPSWSMLGPSEVEHVPALMWPTSLQTYRAVLTDAQVAALIHAIWLPTQRYRVELDPNGMDPAAVQLLADDLDIPIRGLDRVSGGRRRDHFNLRRHIERALSGLVFGHAVFEIVGRIDNIGRWRMQDLAPRPAWTIDQWLTDQAGRLQAVTVPAVSGGQVNLTQNRLVVYTWQGEPGDPRGQSILRPLYRPWVMKDRGMRLDLVTHERNAMGIPVGWTAEGETPADAERMLALLSGVAAGEDTALVLQPGQDFRLRGVEGATSRVLDSVKFANEEMARALLGMVIQLGQTETGSRALGDTFTDLLGMFHQAVIGWVCDTLTEQIAEPWVTFNNADPEAPAPRVVWTEAEDAEPDEPTAAPAATLPPATAAGRRRVKLAARPAVAAAASMLPERELRRAPYEQELAAQTDFAALDLELQTSQSAIAAALLQIREDLAEFAVDAIASMDAIDNATLAATLAPMLVEHGLTLDRETLVGLIEAAAAAGAAQVATEVTRQGADAPTPELTYLEAAEVEAAGLVTRVAQQLAESAGTAARVAVPAAAGPVEIAAAAETQMGALTTALVDRAAGGVAARAQLAGRTAAIEVAPYREIYASELLDANTCGPCRDIDGTQYDSLEDAKRDYPAGGFLGCEGQEACRGTLVAIYDTEQEAAR